MNNLNVKVQQQKENIVCAQHLVETDTIQGTNRLLTHIFLTIKKTTNEIAIKQNYTLKS